MPHHCEYYASEPLRSYDWKGHFTKGCFKEWTEIIDDFRFGLIQTFSISIHIQPFTYITFVITFSSVWKLVCYFFFSLRLLIFSKGRNYSSSEIFSKRFNSVCVPFFWRPPAPLKLLWFLFCIMARGGFQKRCLWVVSWRGFLTTSYPHFGFQYSICCS